MKISLLSTIVLVFLTTAFSLADRKIDRRIGQGIVIFTLQKVLQAPINLFFDVTPIGKILAIFDEDVHIFQEQMFAPLRRLSVLIIQCAMIGIAMIKVGALETLASIAVIIYYAQWVAKYQLNCENIQTAQFH